MWLGKQCAEIDEYMAVDLLLVMEQHVAVMNTMRGSYENEANVTGF